MAIKVPTPEQIVDKLNFELIVNNFTDVILAGSGKITDIIIAIASAFAFIDLLLIFIANRDLKTVINLFVEKFVKYAFFFFIINDFANITKMLLDIFMKLGLIFNVNQDFVSDGAVSLNKVASLLTLQIIHSLEILNGFHTDFLWFLVYMLCVIIILVLIAYILCEMALQVINYYITSVIVLIQLSFNFLHPVSDLGTRAIRALIGSGVKITTFFALCSIGVNIINANQITNVNSDLNNNDVMGLIAWLIMFALIAYTIMQSSKIADVVLTGSGEGLSMARLGSQVTALNTAVVSTGLTVAGIVAGGSGFIKAAADGVAKQGLKEGLKQGAKSSVEAYKKANASTASKAVRMSGNATNKAVSTVTGGEENQIKDNSEKNFDKTKTLYQKSTSNDN